MFLYKVSRMNVYWCVMSPPNCKKKWIHAKTKDAFEMKNCKALTNLKAQKLILELDMENMPEHIRLNWFTMLQQGSVQFNPRFNLLQQMNFSF